LFINGQMVIFNFEMQSVKLFRILPDIITFNLIKRIRQWSFQMFIQLIVIKVNMLLCQANVTIIMQFVLTYSTQNNQCQGYTSGD